MIRKQIDDETKKSENYFMIKSLYLKPSKNEEKFSVDEIKLDENGIEGYTNGDKAISLLDCNSIKEMEKLNYSGFCMKKFYANIVTEGLNLQTLNVGDKLSINDVIIETTQIGKHCFEQCDLIKDNVKCPLKLNCAFAKVIQKGIIRKNSLCKL